jgi:hypothetical protein
MKKETLEMKETSFPPKFGQAWRWKQATTWQAPIFFVW